MNTPDFAIRALENARALLLEPTPLTRDCGPLCGAACCQADEDGRGGMLLFPGEAALYASRMPEGFALSPDDSIVPGGQLLSCEGTCAREDRPLACRLFPLVILLEEGGEPTLALDPRAWPICPLMPSGIAGLSSAFVAAAREAAEALAQAPETRAFLIRQTAYLARLAQPLWESGVGA